MPIIEPNEMLVGSPLPGWKGKFFHAAHMTFGLWDVESGATDLHEHHHEQEEVWNVIEGEVVLVLESEEHRVGPGHAAVVPPHTRHAVRVVGAFRALVTDYPLRPDLPGVFSGGAAAGIAAAARR